MHTHYCCEKPNSPPVVCPTLHTWGGCWENVGDVLLESSSRGSYLVRIVTIHSNGIHIHTLTVCAQYDYSHMLIHC